MELFFHLCDKKITIKHIIVILSIILFTILWFIFLDLINYKCPIHELFHIWCSGCGGMRMTIALLHGNFYQAFRYNPLVFILLIVSIIYLLIMIIIYIKKKVIILPSKYVWLFILFLLIIYMILRNISFFSYLIPTEV